MTRTSGPILVALAVLIGSASALWGANHYFGSTLFSSSPQQLETEGPSCDLTGARFSTRGWQTDFTTCSVSLRDFQSGGPARDGIPPIDQPKFESVSQANAWLRPTEPVIFLDLPGDARAYPLQILIWHEIVNDWVSGLPVSVTFCPLCNTAITFDRQLEGYVLDFGTTGNLRLSDLVMWDRQTESWWQQATGEAVVGELTGKRLAMLPASTISWAEFREQRPQGLVLSRDTGHRRDYGRNPYVGYDDINQSPFLLDSRPDSRLRPMERVVAVSMGGENVAYPFSSLRDRGLVADRVGGFAIVVLFEPGTASIFGAGSGGSSQDVGATAVYVSPEWDGEPLAFTWDGNAFVDAQTGSRWTLLGQATAGPLAGSQLQPVVHVDAFWFATAAFYPQIRIWTP